MQWNGFLGSISFLGKNTPNKVLRETCSHNFRIGEHFFPNGSTFFLGNKYWGSTFSLVKKVIQEYFFQGVLIDGYTGHLCNKCYQGISQVKNQITLQILVEKLKQLGLWNCCLAFWNSKSMLYFARSKSRMYFTIALTFSAVQLK